MRFSNTEKQLLLVGGTVFAFATASWLLRHAIAGEVPHDVGVLAAAALGMIIAVVAGWLFANALDHAERERERRQELREILDRRLAALEDVESAARDSRASSLESLELAKRIDQRLAREFEDASTDE